MTKPTAAILGASTDRSKFGNISLRAHIRQGFTVYPINPKEPEVEGLKAYAVLGDLPVEKLDRISVYLPPHILVKALDDIATVPHDQLWLNPGTESQEVLDRAEELGLKPISGCSIIDIGLSPSEV